MKIKHPLLDVAAYFPPADHDAKLNFRLTVPVLLHLLRVPPEEHWVLPVLTALAICCILLTSCLFAFRVTGDRICGLFLALEVASTYIGSFGFTFCYDAIAISQLALAMLPGVNWFAKGLLVFTAAFTDERAFLAAPLLIAQGLCSPSSTGNARRQLLNLDVLAVIGGMACYGLGRLLLMEYAGLSSPTGGVGLGVFEGNVRFWHAGIWFALKGGWLLVGLAMLALWQSGRVLGLGVLALGITGILVCGFMVGDVLRSTSYVFPALFVALAVISRNESLKLVRAYCFVAFLISALAGNYNVWLKQIYWFEPLAARFAAYVLHVILHHA